MDTKKSRAEQNSENCMRMMDQSLSVWSALDKAVERERNMSRFRRINESPVIIRDMARFE